MSQSDLFLNIRGNAESAKKSLRDTASRLKDVDSASKQATTSAKSLGATIYNFKNQTQGLVNIINHLRDINLGITLLRNTVGAAVGASIKYASDAIEVLNTFNVVMGDSAKAALDYANKVHNALGINKTSWLETQTQFAAMLKGYGLEMDKVAVMSQQLTQLSYDLASARNRDQTETARKLMSGMAGQMRPLLDLGYDLSKLNLQLNATNMGIEQNVSEMTRAQRAMISYETILNNVTFTQDDFARTLGSPANQLRLFKDAIKDVGTALGYTLVPFIAATLPYLIAFARAVTAALVRLRSFLSFLSNLLHLGLNFEDDFGFGGGGYTDTLAEVEEGFGDIGGSAAGAGKKVKEFKKQLLGFDEINNISPQDNSSGGGGGGGAGGGGGSPFDIDPTTYDFLDGLTYAIEKFDKKVESFFTKIGRIARMTAVLKFLSRFAKALKVINKLSPFDKFALKEGEWASFSERLLQRIRLGEGATFDEVLYEWLSKSRIGRVIDRVLSGEKVGDILANAFTPSGRAVKAWEGFTKALQPVKTAVKAIAEWVGKIASFIKKIPGIKLIFKGVGKFLPILGNILLIVDAIKFLRDTIEDFQDGGFRKVFDTWWTKWNVFLSNFKQTLENLLLWIEGKISFSDIFTNGIYEYTRDENGNGIVVPVAGNNSTEKYRGATSVARTGSKIAESVVGKSGNKSIRKTSALASIFKPTEAYAAESASGKATAKVKKTTEKSTSVFQKTWQSAIKSTASYWEKNLPASKEVKVKASPDKESEEKVNKFNLTWNDIKDRNATLRAKGENKTPQVFTDLKNVWNTLTGKKDATLNASAKNKTPKTFTNLSGYFKNMVGKKTGSLTTDMQGRASAQWIQGLKVIAQSGNKFFPSLALQAAAIWPVLDKLPKYAEGGLVNAGQMFIARENGIPELVGRIGSQTAVANNDQIVAAVSQGVAQAVAATLGSRSGSDRVVLQVNLDGRQIIESINRANRTAGGTLLEVY